MKTIPVPTPRNGVATRTSPKKRRANPRAKSNRLYYYPVTDRIVQYGRANRLLTHHGIDLFSLTVNGGRLDTLHTPDGNYPVSVTRYKAALERHYDYQAEANELATDDIAIERVANNSLQGPPSFADQKSYDDFAVELGFVDSADLEHYDNWHREKMAETEEMDQKVERDLAETKAEAEAIAAQDFVVSEIYRTDADPLQEARTTTLEAQNFILQRKKEEVERMEASLEYEETEQHKLLSRIGELEEEQKAENQKIQDALREVADIHLIIGGMLAKLNIVDGKVHSLKQKLGPQQTIQFDDDELPF